jgi:hypothetical protein
VNVKYATKKMEQSASTEKNAAATINGPRPKHAAKIPGSTQTHASKKINQSLTPGCEWKNAHRLPTTAIMLN